MLYRAIKSASTPDIANKMRKIRDDLTKINDAIQNGTVSKNENDNAWIYDILWNECLSPMLEPFAKLIMEYLSDWEVENENV